MQVMAHEMEREARKFVDIVDFRRVERTRDRLIKGGRLFYDRVLAGLSQAGVDIANPVELLLALRSSGGRKLEKLFGAGREDETHPGGRRPVVPTTMFQQIWDMGRRIKEEVHSRQLRQRAKGGKVLLLSTDVHEYAKLIMGMTLREAGVEVIDLGHSVDPGRIVKELLRGKVDAIGISTHNGMALTYARGLLQEMRDHDLEIPIFMGGRLNEMTGEGLPRDVTAELVELKVIPCSDVFDMLERLP
ncbi:MAG TPA: hypothetical protein G4O03_07355 [Dehalococcoidia bacterium]|nr:hypothetical protein [Dehalococcoidia bacterium]